MKFRLHSLLLLAGAMALAGCTTEPEKTSKKAPAAVTTKAPAPPAPAAADGPYPTLVLSQAQFIDKKGPDGRVMPVPGPARLTIIRQTPQGWQTSILEDPESNVFHKATAYGDGLLTIGGNQAKLKTWKMQDGAWVGATHWSPSFGGRFDRLRDYEQGDVDGDGKDEIVIATHDQGVIVIIHPDEGWRVEQIDAEANTFVHEIELGDVDGDGQLEIFATPSKPNKLDQHQPGKVTGYRRGADGVWTKETVDAPGDTHAKEILTADTDQDGKAEVFIVWEGAMDAGKLVREVTIKQYRWDGSAWDGVVAATLPDRLTRAMAAGDVTGNGSIDLVVGTQRSGLYLLEQKDGGWTKRHIDRRSSGFEHPLTVADVDGDGALEVYVVSEDQAELRQYILSDGNIQKKVITKLRPGDITWNVNAVGKQ
ncbi:MAG: VCBS repeat-containing protein [Deltaproteobacteria bacterium]